MCSCGNGKLSEQQLNELEGRAEKGNVEAVQQLVDYYGNMTMPLSPVELKELSEKPDKTPEESQKLEECFEIQKNYEKWAKTAEELGIPQNVKGQKR